MVSYFDGGNRFSYENVSYPETSDYIHAYLGIHDSKLKFFLIPQAYDKVEYHDTISDYTQVCDVYWTVAGTHVITNPEAKARMERWQKDYKAWVPKQAEKTDGMFQAFNVPADDFESDGCIGTLGLQMTGTEGPKTADLIIANHDNTALIEFDDYATPVPPYGATASAASFYLLQAI
jgi:hypothetical protein